MFANVKDRSSIERVYSIDTFAVDAAANAKQPANELLRGVRILSAPDKNGTFDIEPGIKHVGEVHSEAFLISCRTLCGLHAQAAVYQFLKRDVGSLVMSRTGQIYAIANPDPRVEYAAFIARIIAAAPRVGFHQRESSGFDDARLQGLRQ
jgi:hypothetical protein